MEAAFMGSAFGPPEWHKGPHKPDRGHREHREGHQSWMLVFWGQPVGHLNWTKGHISQTGHGAQRGPP